MNVSPEKTRLRKKRKDFNMGVPAADSADSFTVALWWSSSQIIAMFSRGNDKLAPAGLFFAFTSYIYDVHFACDGRRDVK